MSVRVARRRWWALVVVLLVIGCVAWLTRGAGDALFYRPDADDHGSMPAGSGSVWFRAADGTRLHGVWLPAIGEQHGTVVYCHGNHANLTHHLRFVAWLPEHGYRVLIFDYRGFGRSEGSPTRAGTVQDVLAAIDVALARDPERTVVFGHSLGAAIGIVATAQRPAVRGVIAESTFPSYRAAARGTVPWLGFVVPWFVSDGFDPIDVLHRLPPRPLLVIHGTADHITPFELGQRLFDAAAEPKELWAVDGARHATPWVRLGAEFEGRVIGFLGRAIGG